MPSLHPWVTAMANDLTMIGFPEPVLRAAVAGVLIEEGEVGERIALGVCDGSVPLAGDKAMAPVMRAVRKVSSVLLTLRAHDMLKQKGV